ncbi:MAG: MurR/RpiR family transcriptional regulator [Candidatus Accumulibacter sp.]|jgi:DNA-binding MurR/RpiR family transcriptional regulator|nr:MurR/RpiR family transcriptional regulator [Accumulibacter sp.]
MNPASNYEDLKTIITRSYPELSGRLKRIARFTLEHPNDLALGTVAAVARSANVQPSAVIRFANAMGYSGFSEMQQIFRGNLLERSDNYRERILQMRSQRADDGDRNPAGVLHQLVSDAVGDLGKMEESIASADIAAAAELIATCPRVFLLAQRRSFPVVSYLGYALSRLELRTHLLDGVGGLLKESLGAISQGDVLIVVSFLSYSPEVIEAAAKAHEAGIAVIAITDWPLSPLKNSSRVCLEVALDSTRAFRSLVAPMCLAQTLVVQAGYCLAEQKQNAPAKTGRPRRAS